MFVTSSYFSRFGSCLSPQVILLDLIPSMDSQTFITSFKRFICRRGCLSNAISGNGKIFRRNAVLP